MSGPTRTSAHRPAVRGPRRRLWVGRQWVRPPRRPTRYVPPSHALPLTHPIRGLQARPADYNAGSARPARHPPPVLPTPALPTTASPLADLARQAVAAALAALAATSSLALPAGAVLNSPNARIPRSADVALRRSIPTFNQDVRAVQTALESVSFKLRIPQRKPWVQMAADVAAAEAVLAARSN